MHHTDQQAREQALDASQSFIVQAPAGSGKTELLTQRFLRLLAHVDNPESIIAITFTKKAASEMRHRITLSLQMALGQRPQETHKQTTYELAQAALKQNQKQDWDLLNNPNRLQITTIDALALKIATQMPLIASLASIPEILNDASVCYKQAIDELYNISEHDPDCYQALKTLLLHLDNNADMLDTLLIDLLKKRDQWLNFILNHAQKHDLRERMQQSLRTIIDTHSNVIKQLIPSDSLGTLRELLRHSCKVLNGPYPNNDINELRQIKNLLLTQKNTWRTSIDKRLGFTTEHQHEKTALKNIIKSLEHVPSLQEALTRLDTLPDGTYSHAQWQALSALGVILPKLTGVLTYIFSKNQQSDFIEINLSASRALGTFDEPSDLALYFDYKIQHLLIDEFQDTSITQFHLLTQLLSGWQQDDGRSLFLVGDPMQSIYRFRQAEVGLFQQVQENGIADINLQSLYLTRNFRSSNAMVTWFNTTFEKVFPKRSDSQSGAVCYAPADVEAEASTSACHYHLLQNSTATDEAKQIFQIIQSIRTEHPDDSIAVLAKSRNQLPLILKELSQNQINYSAIDIDPLATLPEISEIMTLIRILIQRADSIAWYAFLRAPYCALMLEDLLTISEYCDGRSPYIAIQNLSELNVSDYAKNRLTQLKLIIEAAFNTHKQDNLALALRELIALLDIDRLYNKQAQQQNIKHLCALIDKLCERAPTPFLSDIESEVVTLYAKAEQADNAIQVMTIHKSKGLEFDHVIIPNLAKAPAIESQQLLVWQQYYEAQQEHLILAPIQSADNNHDRIYQYCRQQEKQRLLYENARLFYVAATRARSQLHLFTHEQKARKGSFLSLIEHHFDYSDTHRYQGNADSQTNQEATQPFLLRIKSLKPIEPIQLITTDKAKPLQFNQSLQRQQAASIGTVMHECLQHNHYCSDIACARLRSLGVANAEDQAKQLITQLRQHRNSSRHQWLFSARDSTKIELGLFEKQSQTCYIIDRTFIDNNTRWIVDFKSATPQLHESHSEFLQHQYDKYYAQLQTYATLYEDIEDLPIKLALYFPLCDLWYEWQYK